MQTLSRVFMMLSVLACVAGAIYGLMLMQESLRLFGADLPRLEIERNLYLLWEFIRDLFGY